METAARFPGTGKAAPIGRATHYTAAIIDTATFKGYLITSCHDPKKSEILFKRVWDKLRDKMISKGEPMEKISSPMIFKLDPLEFLAWADEKAQFIAVASYEDDEVGFAFLPSKELRVYQDGEADMLKAPVSMLRIDVDLTFNMYLHMPKNNRFLLYFKPGFRVTKETVEKLRKFGVGYIYLRRSEEKEFQAYTAACQMQKTLDIDEDGSQSGSGEAA